MTSQPNEPLPIVVNCKEHKKSWILEIHKDNGCIFIQLEQPSFQCLDEFYVQLPPKKAQIYTEDKKKSFVFVDTISNWLGVTKYIKTNHNSIRNVKCVYEGLSKSLDAYGNTFISLHILFRSNEICAGLHLQYINESGEGHLLESHIGSPKELIMLLRAALNQS